MYYIVPKEVILQHARNVAGAHWIDLPDGETVFAKAIFRDLNSRAMFESHSSVVCLPHPVSADPVGKIVALRLAHLGVVENHTTIEVSRLAAKIHALMIYH